ncbi:PDR/VanB family oxidoreductase [Nocardia kruczakiae]|uniref:PDR/VanB family oxidoreductase n=1 Tax=Nocardia kruczakiae TaxID=261477 RepID=UPI0007C75605|nr:PDR/VanB family oxidoreductase [Nocardia kruczakiae]
MSSTSPARVPASLARPGKPDRLMSTYRVATRFLAAIVARTRIPATEQIDRAISLMVAENRLIADDVVGVRLESSDGRPLPCWSPGAHLDLILPSGTPRQYSLCGDPDDHSSYQIAVRRIADGGGGSIEIHDALPVGTTVIGRGPRNGFPFAYPHLARADISRVEFIAAGIGITAILPMVRAAAAAGVDWHLTYLGRSEKTMAFLDEIARFESRRVRIHTGPRLPVEDLLSHTDPRTSVYFCGPPALLHDVRDAIDQQATAGFHFERFSPPPVLGGRAFSVHLNRSKRDVEVAADESALAAIRATSTAVSYSCQQGFCGTCRVRVLSGEVERRGQSAFLDAPDSMLICVDRAASDHLTLEL